MDKSSIQGWRQRVAAAQSAYNSRVAYYQGQLQFLAQDPDPSHQTPEYKTWKRQEISNEALRNLKPLVRELKKELDTFVEVAHGAYSERRDKYARETKWDQFEGQKSIFAAQLRTMLPNDYSKWLAGVMASNDTTEKRAARAAILERVSEIKPEAGPERRLWANQQRRLVDEWEADDQPQDLLELQALANEASAFGNQTVQAIRGDGAQFLGRAPGLWESGPFDSDLGLPSAGGVVESVPVGTTFQASLT